MRRLLLIASALLLSFPALAAPAIDEAGAQALKPRIDDALNYLAQTMQKSGVTMERTGDLMVEPAGTYYAITAPHITLDMPGGIRRTVGMIAINAIPTDDPDVFKVAIALPTPMMDTDAKGDRIGSLSIGSQNMSGLWNMPAAAFIEMNGQYQNIRLTNTAQGLDVSIPAMAITGKLTQSGGTWQGPAQVQITNLSHKDKLASYQAANLRIHADMRGIDFKAPATSSKTPVGMNAAQAVFADFVTRYADEADITVTADDVSFQGARSGTLKTASLQTNLKGLKNKSASANWNLGLDGIALTDPAAQRFTPSRIAFKGAGEKLPVDDLARMAQGASWTKLLADAGSGITVENLILDAPAYGVDAKGNFVASAASPLGGIGDLSVKVRGVQELNTWLASPAAAQALGVQSVPQQLVAILAIVQLTGKDGTDASGRPTKDFDLKVAPDGKISVNGADMSALSQMGGALGGTMQLLNQQRAAQ